VINACLPSRFPLSAEGSKIIVTFNIGKLGGSVTMIFFIVTSSSPPNR
jgi:hypothetical protein